MAEIYVTAIGVFRRTYWRRQHFNAIRSPEEVEWATTRNRFSWRFGAAIIVQAVTVVRRVEQAMTTRRLFYLCGILAFAAMTTPAAAECNDQSDDCWLSGHHVIAHMENRIAYLEADPNADDGYKGPIIDTLHRRVLRLRTAIGPRWPHWPTPCCYSRRPIYIR